MFDTPATGLFNLGRLRGEMDRLFSDFFETAPRSSSRVLWDDGNPALNLWEDDSSFYAEAELPGLKMDDLEILVVKNELTVKGERKNGEPAGATYHRRERSTGPFTRVVRLPAEVDSEKVHAALRDGVLTITLPKAEAAKPRKIPVVAL